MRPLVAATIALGIGLGTVSSAVAQPTSAASETSTQAPSMSEPPAPPPAQGASELYAAAEEHYAAGDLSRALEYMQRCYETTRNPKLLFNLAELQRELSHCREALDLYQRYLDTAPEGQKRSVAGEWIAALEQKCPPAAAPVVPTSNPPTTAAPEAEQPARPQPSLPPPTHRFRTIGWVAAAAGALATTATVYFAVKSKQAHDDVARWQASNHPTGIDYSSTGIEERTADFSRNQTIAITSGVLAVLAATTAVYAFAVGAPKEEARVTSSLNVMALPDALWIDYTRRF